MADDQSKTTDDPACTCCQGSGWNGFSERVCDCQPRPAERHVPASITVACCMSGTRETMRVEAIGQFGVTFRYGDDASVIARGDDLRRMRAILDRQIANWEAANAR